VKISSLYCFIFFSYDDNYYLKIVMLFFYSSYFHKYQEKCSDVRKMTPSKYQLNDFSYKKSIVVQFIRAIVLVDIVYTDTKKKTHTSW
jgi:hypothetical protein